jgi:hypothetical protein
MSIAKRALDWGTVLLCVAATVISLIAFRTRTAHSSRASTLGHASDISERASHPIDPEAFAAMESTGDRIGPTNAAVTIVVFSSYACGYCAKFDSVLSQLRARYPDHVAVVIKHYLPSVVSGLLAVDLGAVCAGDQGKFEPYHHAAFAHRSPLVGRDSWRSIGDTVGIPDTLRFVSCVRSRRYATRITRDSDDGVRAGVTGTPTSFVNGVPVVGAVPLEVLDSLIAFQLDRSSRPGRRRARPLAR